jgi:hypothetical protein
MMDLRMLNSHEIKSKGISFMKSKLGILALFIIIVLITWSCKETSPTASGVVSRISGVVYDVSASQIIANAAVYLATTAGVDSAYTKSDGTFNFEVDLGTLSSTSATLTVQKAGFLQKSFTISVAADTVVNVGLEIDVATLAIITGTVRDSSAYLYPLRNASVLLILPGYVDSVVTEKEGTFRFTADLIDRDSVQATLTIYKTGYRTKTSTFTIFRGVTKSLGDVLLAVDKASTTAQVIGYLHESLTPSVPITGATVTLVSSLITDSVQTTSNGSFSFTIDLQGLPSIECLLKAAKNGYDAENTTITLYAGKIASQDFYLLRDTTTAIRDSSSTSLYAHSISFVSISSKEIDVYGVGGKESAIITWEVRDSLGFPIDLAHKDTVLFELIGNPTDTSGGNSATYVSPDHAVTNASGRVSTTINSGTRSGEVQFVAKMFRKTDGVWIKSSPVVLTVNAGLPDQAHFTIAPSRYNFAAYDWLGRVDLITTLVGDKYSNPVKIGTAVYYNTTGGVIDATGFVDMYGYAKSPNDQGDVRLNSGLPHPPDDCYAHVVGHTRGENGVLVSDTVIVLFSGVGLISDVSADSFYAPSSGRSSRIYFTVADRFGHPLAAGTKIAVSLQYTAPPNSQVNLTTNGDVAIVLDDFIYPGPGSTRFWFEVVDQTEGGVSSRIPVTAEIKVYDSPNLAGEITAKVSGFVGD